MIIARRTVLLQVIFELALLTGSKASNNLNSSSRHLRARQLGKPICGDGLCNGKETCADCFTDCGVCTGPTCGDGVCEGTETFASCSSDCDPVCGDLICEGTETCSSCPGDCTEGCSPSPATSCGYCAFSLNDANPTSCSSDADCTTAVTTSQCDANCIDEITGLSCEGRECPNGDSDCTPNKGKGRSQCIGSTTVDSCTFGFSCAPSTTPSASPSSAPTATLSPSALPSASPSFSPTLSLPPTFEVGDLTVGMTCSSDNQCLSGHCINGACYASENCQPLKHETGSQFAENQALLVFVPSNFTDAAKWTTEVENVFSIFENYEMFGPTNTKFTALYSTSLSDSYCNYGCSGIDRLLCCDINIARALHADCSPHGSSYHSNVQVVVVHNNVKYGGAGYSSNMATTSIHPSGPAVAVHELGHSMFNLADEYSTGSGTNTRANCDTGSCSKWADLSGNNLVEDKYGSVGCQAGCNGDGYFVGQVSFMEFLSSPVGAVNDRYTCCTYQAITKSMPEYCSIFDFSENYLFNFCKSNDYQGYGSTSYDPAPPIGSSEDTGGNYIQLGDSTIVNVNLDGNESGGGSTWSSVKGGSGVFRREKVKGNWASAEIATNSGATQVYRVEVTYASNRREVFFLSTEETMEVPLEESGSHGNEGRVHNPVSHLDLALDTSGEEIVDVTASLMPVKRGIFWEASWWDFEP